MNYDNEITGDELATRQALVVTFKIWHGCKHNRKVNSLQEARTYWENVRDDDNLGMRDMDSDVKVIKDGKQIAEISYNGRVWKV